MPTTNLEHSPHTTWGVCSPVRKLCCPSVTRSCGCQCLGEHIWGPPGCFFMALCHISSITSQKNLLKLMKINLFIVSDSFLCFTGNAFVLFFPLQLLNPGCLDVKRVAVIYQQALTQFLSKRNSPLTCSMFHDLFKRFPVSAAVLCCLLLPPKNDYNSGESRERNFPALLQTFEIAVRISLDFHLLRLLNSGFIGTLQEVRILFMVCNGILHAGEQQAAL